MKKYIHVRNIMTNQIVDIPPHWMNGPLKKSFVLVEDEDFYKCPKQEEEPIVKRSYTRKIKESNVE